jgi:hypothetical protein
MGSPKLSATVESWLENHAVRHAWLSIAGSAASLLGGIVVLYITYWFVTLLMWMVFDWLVPSPEAKATATWIVLGLLFVGYFTANWQHLENLEFESRGKLFTARLAGLAAGSPFLNLAAGPKTAHSFVKVISATVLLGPGLVVTSWRLLVRAKRLFLLDTAACAKPIAAVLKAGRKVPLDDLADKHPHIDWEQVLPQLCLIDGVVILRSEPVGVAITDGLRDTIGVWRAAHKDDA